MKIQIFTFISALTIGIQVYAVNLDLKKLRSKGLIEIEKLIGSENINSPGQIYFRDGAGSIDLEPVFDYACFVYVVGVKPGLLPKDDLKLGYRLGLNGIEDIILLSDPEKDSLFDVSMPNSGVVTMKGETSDKDIENLILNLSQQVPKAKFTYLKTVKILLYDSDLNSVPSIIKELRNSSLVLDIGLDYENYRVIFDFDQGIRIADQGVIDADRYRDLTKQLKAKGFHFATETTVPLDLQ